MESERGIIIIGHCRQGKRALMQKSLKERLVLVGVDFADIGSAMASLNMSFDDAAISVKYAIDSINELKKITPDKIVSMDDCFRDEALKLRSFQEDLKTIVYEKVQSKFISKPRNNFRKR
jgi:hypothetical protein